MKKRIRNIALYLLFLSIGAGLFYLATLDITQGALVVESAESPFRVGSGLESCEGDKRLLQLEPVDAALDGTSFTVRSYSGAVVHEGTLSQDNTSPVSFCVSEGAYVFVLPNAPEEGQSVVLNGVNRMQEFKDDLSKANFGGLILSFILGYLAIVSRGIRWQFLLEPLGYKPKMWHSIHAVAFAYFANTFVPRSGELARCAALNQTDDIPVDRLFGTVISERVIDMVMLLLFMAVAVLTNLDAFTLLLDMGKGSGASDDSGYGFFFWVLVALGVAVAAFFFLRRSVFLGTLIHKIKGFLLGVGDGLKSVLRMRRKWAFIGHTIFIWAMYYLMAYVIYMSIDATSHMDVFQCLFVMVAGGFGIVLPAPGGIGSYHWTVKLGFIALGMSGALGFAVANVLWLTQTLMIITGGGIGYLMLMWYRIRKARQETQADVA